VQAGQPLLAIVQLDEVWIVANYKETQLKDIRPGQRATSTSMRSARGFNARSAVSRAPPARASACCAPRTRPAFVKVVQRVPVKIVLDAGQIRASAATGHVRHYNGVHTGILGSKDLRI